VTEVGELTEGAAALGVSLDSSQLEKLLKFAALLERWNGAFNLVSRGDIERLGPRHLLDSLSLVRYLKGPRVVDLGTGAGLPGLPLAIVREATAFTLVDRNERRIRFVRQASFELGLSNVDAIASDFVRFRPGDLFDTVVSRAVTTPSKLWRVAAPLLAPGGQALFLVGASLDDIGGGAASIERIDIRVPGLSRPHQLLRLTAEMLPQKEADR
jgi:16S rRNA (guanine527-N7)-methyltransferase